MRTIELSITQEDINLGKPGECSKCPVALALKRAVPIATFLEVDTRTIYFHEPPNLRWFAYTPGTVDAFIQTFDNRKPVAPFQVTLEFQETVCSPLDFRK